MRDQILEEINKERERQEEIWGVGFDDKNTRNDFVAYIAEYAGRGSTYGASPAEFRKRMVQVAALAVSAVETFDRLDGGMAARHYDNRAVQP